MSKHTLALTTTYLLLTGFSVHAETTIVPAPTPIAPTVTAAPVAKSSDQIQDAAEAMKLLPTQLQMMQIAFSMLGGDAAKSQALAQSALTDVNKVLAENPQSLAGLQTRCALKNMMEKDTGSPDCEQGVIAASARITKYPTNPDYYEQRANLHDTLGHNADALADLTKARELTTDPKEQAKLDKKIEKLKVIPAPK
jgi:hypothetical protein